VDQLYSYSYLYKITSTSSAFIRKMITIFITALDDYLLDLHKVQISKNVVELKKVAHKMKPSVLNLEVKGAAAELELISKLENWSPEAESSILRLIQVLEKIKPLMQRDLLNFKDTDQ
jgi:hypothetical protein